MILLFRNFLSFCVKWVSERPKISYWFWFKVSSIRSFFVGCKRLFVLSKAIFIEIEIYSGSIDKVWFGMWKCIRIVYNCLSIGYQSCIGIKKLWVGCWEKRLSVKIGIWKLLVNGLSSSNCRNIVTESEPSRPWKKTVWKINPSRINWGYFIKLFLIRHEPIIIWMPESTTSSRYLSKKISYLIYKHIQRFRLDNPKSSMHNWLERLSI